MSDQPLPGEIRDDRRKQWILDKISSSIAADSTRNTTATENINSEPSSQAPSKDVANQSNEEEKIIGTNIHVSNMSVETTEDDLKAAIARIAPVKKVVIIKDTETGVSRGYGFYILENEDDIGTSIRELNGFVLHDRSLRVDIAKKQYNGMPAPRLKGGVPFRGDRRDYRDDLHYRGDRRRDDFGDRLDYGGRQFTPSSGGPYRSGDPSVSMRPYGGSRPYDFPVSYRSHSPIRYPVDQHGYGARDPLDRYNAAGDRYRQPQGAYIGDSAGLSPSLSRYDNRYDIMERETPRVGIDPYAACGAGRYGPAEPVFETAYRVKDYRAQVPLTGGYSGYGTQEEPRRSRSRSRERLSVSSAYDGGRAPATGYSGNGAYGSEMDARRGYGTLSGRGAPYESTGYGVSHYAADRMGYRRNDTVGYDEYPRVGEGSVVTSTLMGTSATPYESMQRGRR